MLMRNSCAENEPILSGFKMTMNNLDKVYIIKVDIVIFRIREEVPLISVVVFNRVISI